MAKTAQKSAEVSNRPVHEIRLGRVKCAVWENELSNGGTRHNVTFQRIFLGDDKKWQTSSSFGRDDLPLIQKVSDMAHTWIYQQGQENASEGRAA